MQRALIPSLSFFVNRVGPQSVARGTTASTPCVGWCHAQAGASCCRLVPAGAGWCRPVQAGAGRFRLVQAGAGRFRPVQAGAGWCRLV